MIRTYALVVAVSIAALALPVGGGAAVRIELTNGMTMTADSCEASGSVLTCYKMGGTFELDRKDVASMAETKGGGDEPVSMAIERETSAQAKDAPAGSADKKDSAGDGQQRFDEIQKRKKELQSDREKLDKDRGQLQQDIKSAPDWMTDKQFDELSKRNKDVDERVKKFNEEVKRLDEEQTKIVGSRKKKDETVKSPAAGN